MKQDEKIILIVEDDAATMRILSDKLEKEGFRVLQAKHGQEGLAVAKEHHPDLILLDILMPVMDGMTMLRLLREDAWGKHAVVILLTNLNDADRISEGVAEGVRDYLVKTDWKIDEVISRIRDRLGA